MEDFMGSLTAKRSKFAESDIKEYLECENLFKNGKLEFDTFKKAFFPHLFHIAEEVESDEENENIKKF
jgi:hypothetical protein